MTGIKYLAAGFKYEPYITVNIVLTGIIILIMIYSGIFNPAKNNYPVTCIHEKITGKPCISCGLSHSFSLILRGRIAEAYDWNRYGLRIFLFFFAQLLMRITFSVFYLKAGDYRKQLIIYDITGTTVIFLIAFLPFLTYIL
ncbi:MAG: DUF2752 domain-containing protein [Bacteroidales bacterium]